MSCMLLFIFMLCSGFILKFDFCQRRLAPLFPQLRGLAACTRVHFALALFGPRGGVCFESAEREELTRKDGDRTVRRRTFSQLDRHRRRHVPVSARLRSRRRVPVRVQHSGERGEEVRGLRGASTRRQPGGLFPVPGPESPGQQRGAAPEKE